MDKTHPIPRSYQTSPNETMVQCMGHSFLSILIPTWNHSNGVFHMNEGWDYRQWHLEQLQVLRDAQTLQLWPWLPVITGDFDGIIHSINGVTC